MLPENFAINRIGECFQKRAIQYKDSMNDYKAVKQLAQYQIQYQNQNNEIEIGQLTHTNESNWL